MSTAVARRLFADDHECAIRVRRCFAWWQRAAQVARRAGQVHRSAGESRVPPRCRCRSILREHRGTSIAVSARVYQRHFLRSLRRKALAKLDRYPDLVSRGRVESARTLYDFDDVVTAPVHGFADAADYYARSSSIRLSFENSRSDAAAQRCRRSISSGRCSRQVARVAAGNPRLDVEFLMSGGHVGFVSGQNPLRPFYYAEWRVTEFFDKRSLPLTVAPLGALRSDVI